MSAAAVLCEERPAAAPAPSPSRDLAQARARYAAEAAADIAWRQECVSRLGAVAALDHFIAIGAQGRVALDVLTPRDLAELDRLFPTPEGGPLDPPPAPRGVSAG